MTDTVSMVAVNWLEQTVDGTSGQLRPTQRTVEVVDPVVMSVIGARRLSVSTQLIIETDADIQARNWLSRSSVMAWRIEGLRWDTTGELDPDGTQTVLTLLDGTLRNGLPIVLTDLPPWMDALTHGDSAALYVEGGTYSYNAGAWELELTTSSATGSAAGALPWQNLEPGWSWDEFDPTISWLDLYGCSYPAE
jgi:hypothetical protein